MTELIALIKPYKKNITSNFKEIMGINFQKKKNFYCWKKTICKITERGYTGADQVLSWSPTVKRVVSQILTSFKPFWVMLDFPEISSIVSSGPSLIVST